MEGPLLGERRIQRLERIAQRLLRIFVIVITFWGLALILEMLVWSFWLCHAPLHSRVVYALRLVALRTSGKSCLSISRFQSFSSLPSIPPLFLSCTPGIIDTWVLGGLCGGCLLVSVPSEDHEASHAEFVSSIPQQQRHQKRMLATAHGKASSDVFRRDHSNAHIFVTTFNMGGLSGAKDVTLAVSRWMTQTITKGSFDLYIIATQECVYLDLTRNLIHQALGRYPENGDDDRSAKSSVIGNSYYLRPCPIHTGGPGAYTMFCRECGDHVLLHGHGVIALTIYAKTADVENGAMSLHEAPAKHVHTGVSVMSF